MKGLTIVLGVAAILMGAMGTWIGLPSGAVGLGSVTRTLMGLAGVAGGVLLFTRRDAWYPLLLAWSLLQIPLIIVDPSGPLTAQGCHLGMSRVEQTSVNDVITSMSGFGFNAVGLLLAIVVIVVRRSQTAERDAAPQ